MDRKLRPLAPARPSGPDAQPSSSSATKRPKRQAIPVACELCRRRKIRCDGQRPACKPCRSRRNLCVYPSAESDAGRRQLDLKKENTQLRELFRCLSVFPLEDTIKILDRIRAEEDPIAVVRLARATELSISAGVAPNAVLAGAMRSNPRLQAIDLRALTNSPIKLSACPWTTVASDGLVSDLVASFFRWDNTFLFPFIDRDAFIMDMRGCDIENASYCSPLLVNAICASRCFTSRAAKAFGAASGEDLGAQFLNETKKHWDREGSRRSLPTVQALAIMFTISAYHGTDRQGLMYRYAAYEMLNKLNLPEAFSQSVLQDPSAEGLKERAIISKALWGFFCFESIFGFVYLQQSLIPPPTVPRCFELLVSESGCGQLSGMAAVISQEPLSVSGVLDATCQLSEHLYRTMRLNSESEQVGSEEDLAQRRRYYNDIVNWRFTLPNHLKDEENFTFQTAFLRIYYHETLISTFRPLPSETTFREDGHTSTRELLIECALADVELSRRFTQNFTSMEYSCIAICGIYNAAHILVEFLGESRVNDAFVEACAMLRQTARDFPVARFILSGIAAIAWSLNTSVPAKALPFLQNLGSGKEHVQDIPLEFALPQVQVIRNLLGKPTKRANETVAMGILLSKWNALSID